MAGYSNAETFEHATLAQLVEQRIRNAWVSGSTPEGGSSLPPRAERRRYRMKSSSSAPSSVAVIPRARWRRPQRLEEQRFHPSVFQEQVFHLAWLSLRAFLSQITAATRAFVPNRFADLSLPVDLPQSAEDNLPKTMCRGQPAEVSLGIRRSASGLPL
jgi:hypothetical protein